MTVTTQEATTVRCTRCACPIHDGVARHTLDGAPWCTYCAWECTSCHVVHTRIDHGAPCSVNVDMDGTRHRMCDSCANDCASMCENCGRTYHDDLLNYQRECVSCESEREREEQEAEEQEARERARRDLIGPYHCATRRSATRCIPSPWTARYTPPYTRAPFYGLELEVESTGTTDTQSGARAVWEAAHDGVIPSADDSEARRVWCEHDGSLSDGFEIISQPMGLDLHREVWSKMLHTRAVRGLRSHDTTTCGLHVHVSRYGMSALTIAKVVAFMNSDHNDAFVTRIARRDGNGYCKKKTCNSVEARHTRSHDRYERVNLTNARTIEFRVFRGTTNYSTLMGSVEFTHNVIAFCAQASACELTFEKFCEFVFAPSNREDTKDLRALIVRRMSNAIRERIAQYIPTHKPQPTTRTTGN